MIPEESLAPPQEAPPAPVVPAPALPPMPAPPQEPPLAPLPEEEPVPDLPVRVRYTGAPDTPTPVKAAGRYWHARTEFILSAEEAAEALDLPGFAPVVLPTP